nr:pentapeptide repeat-containing protein [cf. Phormidesmis sp. LEGE 11477]
MFIPLHQFDPTGDLVAAVGEFIRYDQYLKGNPLDPNDSSLRLLIIFDGLDELAMQGKVSRETAQAFVQEVKDKVSRFNFRGTRLQVIITGREVVVQESFPESRQIIYATPYVFSVEERYRRTEQYVDADNLLWKDQRHEWWQKYGVAIQKNYPVMPDELQVESLFEITAQPLLNYLVAQSYVSGRLTLPEESNLNTLYADLLNDVYERGYEGSNRRHRAIAVMSKEHFVRVLEEIALAAWHGDGRTTTVEEIEAHCERSGLKRLLNDFEEGAEVGVTRMLAAFYFRQGGRRSEEKAFEFTHKSFREYLSARRIVRAMDRIQRELERREEDMEAGWDERDSLHHWAEVCGPTRMDIYLLDFLRNEVALCPLEQVAKWQRTSSNLIGVMLRQGMPMEKVEPTLKFHEANRRAVNAEEALLAALSACSWTTEAISTVEWPSPESFGGWIARLQAQRIDEENVVSLYCLERLELASLVLIARDFFGANLSGANLSRADLSSANLVGADLSKADLNGADLSGAALIRANLIRAALSGANLSGANLSSANLVGADLSKADLNGADLSGANLIRAALSGANLSGANLISADLSRANLSGANLSRSDLSGANLSRADLNGSDLSAVNLSKADLRGSDLGGADLRRAHLGFISLGKANLSGVNLSGANLVKANLSEANLSGANLSGAKNIGRDQLLPAHLCRTCLPKGIKLDPNRDCERLRERQAP